MRTGAQIPRFGSCKGHFHLHKIILKIEELNPQGVFLFNPKNAQSSIRLAHVPAFWHGETRRRLISSCPEFGKD